MKILMISSFLPYPLLSGGNIRLYNLLKYLHKKHEITLVCEKRDFQKESDVKRVEEICKKVITVPRKKQWSIQNLLKTAISKKPFLMVGHELPEMKREIKNLLSTEQFDLIHIETFYVIHNLPKTEIPKVLVEHNIEHLIYKRYAQNVNILFRPILLLDVWKMRREEEKAWGKASALVSVSEKEKKQIGRENVWVVPNGADAQKFRPKRYRKDTIKKILFIGDFKYIQNIDAANVIIKKIWPLVLENNKDVLLWIVGKDASKKLSKIKGESIIFEDNPRWDTEEIYGQADILLAPIRVGGGTSLKILEAMASGLVVITTPLGNEGIGAKEGEEILIAQEPWEFAAKITDAISSEDKVSEIGTKAREFIEQNYRWEKIAEKLDTVYKQVVA